MPRLLIVTTVPASFPFFLPYADYFRRAGWRVDALTGTLDGFEWRDRFDAVHTVEWSRDPRDLHKAAGAARRVRAIVEEGAYDIVHVHTPVAAFVTRFALRNRDPVKGPKVVYTAHGFHFHPGNPAWKNAFFAGLEKLAARWTDWLVVMNQEDETAARRLRFLPDDRIWRMPGIGMDLRRYGPESVAPGAVAALRQELGIGEDPALLMVAEFTPRKRHVDAIDAFAALAADRTLPRVRLLLAGVGALRPAIERKVHALGLSRRVHFLGLRPDVPVLMKASRALLLPSTQEGLPRCVLEAMAMGLPIVGTRIRGTTELLEGGCGTLVEVGDAKGLAAGVGAVLRNPAAAAEAAARARVRAARYDEPAVVEQHVRLYAAALGAAKASPAPAARAQSVAG